MSGFFPRIRARKAMKPNLKGINNTIIIREEYSNFGSSILCTQDLIVERSVHNVMINIFTIVGM